MSPGLQLSVFGAYHMDSPGKVTRELRALADGADAIFVEYPEQRTSAGELAVAVLRGPLTAVGLLLVFQFVQGPLFVLFNRDLLPTEVVAVERVASDRAVPVYRIDDGAWNILANLGPAGIVANWVILVGLGAIWPVTVVGTVLLFVAALASLLLRVRERRVLALLAFGGWYLLAGLVTLTGYLSLALLIVAYVAYQVFARTTLGSRNRSMLDRIGSISAERGYETATFVTGQSHLRDVARRAGDRDVELEEIHASRWRKDGVTVRGVAPAVLPHASDLGLDLEIAEETRVEPGSENSVFGRRVAACAVDFLATLSLVLGIIAIPAVPAYLWTEMSLAVTLRLVVVLAVPVWLLFDPMYRTIREYQQTPTIGKRVTGLAVASADDYGDPSTQAVVVRGLGRLVDGIGGYLLGGFAVAVTDRNQRLGDLAAGTVVGRRVNRLDRLREVPAVVTVGPSSADDLGADGENAAGDPDSPGAESGSPAAGETRTEADDVPAPAGDRR